MELLKTLFKNTKANITTDEIFYLLKRLKVLYFDLEYDESEDRTYCIDRLRDKFNLSNKESSSLFDKLCSIATELRANSGSINRTSLFERVPEYRLDESRRINTGLLELDELKVRPDVKAITNTKFVGREYELSRIDTFVSQPDNKIMLIVGDGGVGKTRLAVEFVERYNRDKKYSVKHIFFFQENTNLDSISIPTNSLLVVDEASYLADLEKVVSYVLSAGIAKLLLIDRSIFRRSIISRLNSKKCDPQVLEIKKGEINVFLNNNFPLLDEEKRSRIDRECRNSFDYAIILSEFYQENYREHKTNIMEDILDWKVSKYIKDLEAKTGYRYQDIAFALDLLSLASPLNWEKEKTRLTFLSNSQSTILDSLLSESQSESSDLIVCIDDSNFTIKPDVLADYIRMKSLERGNLQSILNSVVISFPFRITHNLAVLLQYVPSVQAIAKAKLEKVWDNLNQISGKSPEYFLAARFFINSKHEQGIEFDMKKCNVECWNESFEKIYANFPTDEVVDDFGSFLSNAIVRLNEAQSYQKSKKVIEILRDKYAAHRQLEKALVTGLQNITLHFGHGSLKESKYYIDILREVYEQSGDCETRTSLMGALGNVIMDLIQDPELALKYLDEIRSLIHEDDNSFHQRMSIEVALNNAIYIFSKLGRPEELEANLTENRWHKISNSLIREILSKYLV